MFMTWNEHKPRRLAILEISCESLLDLFRWDGTQIPYMEGVPKDAKIVGIQQDIYRNSLKLVLESEEFREVREEQHLSTIDIKLTVQDLYSRKIAS